MNQLAAETSPYLLQHKKNPVHWLPWGETALNAATQANKPIIVSIGYAACHWCHVMAHECFEDPAIANLMNENFISIKIDREERPDLDTIYQSALALLGQQGGWPLTMFCTPKGKPFWGGTYFPPEPRHGQPGFPQILTQLASLYKTSPDQITQNVDTIHHALDKLSTPPPQDTQIPLPTSKALADQLAPATDAQFGGIGNAPKFPHTPIITLLWNDKRHRDKAVKALDHMAQGGIYDHLGGGFARYTVDRAWQVPHFEKMLYDNAQLLEVYTHAWQATANPLYAERVEQTITWLLRDMLCDPAPAFASSFDADSEGEEGRFYIWQSPETTALLGDAATLFHRHYDVTPTGNWEGKNILNRSSRPQLADQATETILAQCRATLLSHRNKRVPPTRDDKILADWNGLTIAALAHAAYAFNQPRWHHAAKNAYLFVSDQMQTNGNLKHAWRLDTAKHTALLDDYANMARAALILYEYEPDPTFLHQAETWVSQLNTDYSAPNGGYYLTAQQAKDVIHRSQTASDNATPPGNATMVETLSRLYHHTGKDAYRHQAEATLNAFAGALQTNPASHTSLTNARAFHDNPVHIAITGPLSHPNTQNLHQVIRQTSLPARILTQTETGTDLPEHHPAHAISLAQIQPTAIVCQGRTCSLPLATPQALTHHLSRL